jgi:hypothetical protein
MTRGITPVAWMSLGVVLGTLATSAFVSAQGGIVPPPRQEVPRPPLTSVLSGGDIGFRLLPGRGDRPVVVPVVKVKGEWVDAELGGTGGIRMLTR